MMGKNVLIVGASGDIGMAIAKELVNNGYSLILHYNKNKQPIDTFCKTVNDETVLDTIQANLSKKEDIQKLINGLVYPVDSIVYVSGMAHFGLFQDVNEKTMDEMLDLHVKAPWLITQHILPEMIKAKTGKIIFITSLWGNVGASHEVIYSSVKGAQNSFVKALAKEVAPSGISVNAVSPGFIDTKMNGHLLANEKEAIISEIPMNRPGLPDEIAYTVGFLMSEKANYIQGEIVKVTGGW